MKLECGLLDLAVMHPRLGALRLRSLGPGDEGRVAAFLKRLSEESLFSRFMRSVRDPRRLAPRILGDDVLAIIAVEKGVEVIALGEVHRASDPRLAEPALAVLDEYQGMGLGKLLLAVMACCAASAGVRVFRAYALSGNAAVARLAAMLEGRIAADYGDVVLYEMDLAASKRRVEGVLAGWGLRVDCSGPPSSPAS